jgi:hypothetical protein
MRRLERLSNPSPCTSRDTRIRRSGIRIAYDRPSHRLSQWRVDRFVTGLHLSTGIKLKTIPGIEASTVCGWCIFGAMFVNSKSIRSVFVLLVY